MLRNVFAIAISVEDWNHQDSLPVYMSDSYNFNTAYIADKRCIILTPKGALATVPALKKQIAQIRQIDNVPIVLELAAVSAYRRESLIENRIPFITRKQIFLPFIGTLLTEEKQDEGRSGKFFPRSNYSCSISIARKNGFTFQKQEKNFLLRQ